jgi:8-oxo-dGTP diphosphatase
MKIIKAVIGIIERDNKILMSQRLPHQSYPGQWEFPGGKIEENELPLAALKRELHEELGIEVVRADHWLQHDYAYPDYRVLLEVYRVTDFLHEPVGKEGQMLCWAALSDISQLEILAGSQFIYNLLKK